MEKFRASYGTTGSDQIGDYRYLNLYSPPFDNYLPYQGCGYLVTNGLPNPYLQWEETKKFQVGLDLGIRNDRLNLSINYIQNRSSNQLLDYALPSFTGFDLINSNFPATVQNRSWEISFNSINVTSKKFQWNSSFNLTLPKNKLVSFPGIETSTYALSLVVGESISSQKLYKYLGADPATGNFNFGDGNGGQTTRPDTLNYATATSLFDLSPKFYGGFQNSFKCGAIQLDVFLQFSKQTGPKY